MDQAQKDALIAAVKDYLIKQQPVLFAYLYGSFAEGRPFHDVDVAAYVDPESFTTTDELFNHGLSLSAELDLAISGVTVDLRLLNLAPTPFRFSVISKGSLLFTKDETQRIDFEGRTRSLYFDFQPHLRFYQRNLIFGE